MEEDIQGGGCVMETEPVWHENLSLEDAKIFIRQNIATAAKSFIAVGYYLKQVRDRELFLADGHSSIWAFAMAEYGISKSTASRYMAINDRFSQGGNSPWVKEEYRDFSRSQLQEMLYLTDDQLEQVRPEAPVLGIRQMRKDMPSAIEIPGQMEISDFPEYLPDHMIGQEYPSPTLPASAPGSFQLTISDLIGTPVAVSQQQDEAKVIYLQGDTGYIYGADRLECPAIGSEDKTSLRLGTKHHLKTLPEYFEEAKNGRKTFEIRVDDRNIQTGDIVVLEEFDGSDYTGDTITVTVTYVLRDCERYGLMDGYCIFCWKEGAACGEARKSDAII